MRDFALCLALACSISCSASDRSAGGSKFKIVVVGDGVPQIRLDLQRPFPLNRAQGDAMWRGAEAAYARSPRLTQIRALVELEGRDDASLASEASTFSSSVKTRPEILAVVGHATSETTRAAIEGYADSGVPLLMPIATSDLAMLPAGRSYADQRVRIAFRLPASDGRAQAPALAYLAAKLGLKNPVLLHDSSQGAVEYSSNLLHFVEPLLQNTNKGTAPVRREDKASFSAAAAMAKANNADGIVFCGYGSTAQELFEHLREAYMTVPPEARPRVILTDGCRIPDLNTAGFETFMTFPHTGVRTSATFAERDDIEIVKGLLEAPGVPSYEPFGYDAMLILGQAVDRCLKDGPLTRQCILRMLDGTEPFFGVVGDYEFESGENRLSSYDIFANKSGDKGSLLYYETIPADDLTRIRRGTHP